MITDRQRVARGLHTVAEVLELAENGLVVLDPYSVLISTSARLGPGSVCYPGVVVECDAESTCVLGVDNVLLPGTYLVATGGGSVRLGDGNRIGEGGARLTSEHPDAPVRIGDRVRVNGGAAIAGPAWLGDGSQVLGAINAQRVTLAAGGDWTHPDPDARGGVLKGLGRARGIEVGLGEVVNGCGDFAAAPVERQLVYHPR
ncbi:hypothetical protein AB0M36_03120 [Actinoplanes sp. NPDC051346]|uniref:hypothetical protein n=1 Tax=Actinoplanes sp. NPDC051346 TaxID=3155048 RepID=UPI00342F51AA